MKKNTPSRIVYNALLCPLLLLSFLFSFNTIHAQNPDCDFEQTYGDREEHANSNQGYGQSFTSECSRVIRSISVTTIEVPKNTNVTLSLYSGEIVGTPPSNPIYTGNVTWSAYNGKELTEQEIVLTQDINFIKDNKYTFMLMPSENITFAAVNIGATDRYTGGSFIRGNSSGWSKLDGGGEYADTRFKIKYQDITAPVARCQPISVTLGADGTASLNPADVDDRSSDAGSGIDDNMTISPSTIDCNAVNTPLPVTLTVYDKEGNSDTCTTTVTAIDNTPPVPSTCPADIIATDTTPFFCGSQVAYTIPTFTDTCDSELDVKLIEGLASESYFKPGITTVTYEATDDSGNKATCSFNVIVNQLGSCDNDLFITEWTTESDNQEITIPTEGSGYNYLVDWGDGTVESGLTGDASHTYASSGTYEVKILGDFPRIRFRTDDDNDIHEDIRKVIQWGSIEWTSMQDAFYNCVNLDVTATDVPNLSNVTSLQAMFGGCTSLVGNGAFNDWAVSGVTDMYGMFNNAASFNQDLGDWDVSNVTSMSIMFQGAGLTTANYEGILIGWSKLTLRSNVLFHGGGASYCSDAAVAARNRLTAVSPAGFQWDITDGGQYCDSDYFITTWKTTQADQTIKIPTTGGGYSYEIDWEYDGQFNATGGTQTGDATSPAYTDTGNHVIAIRGDFPRIHFERQGNLVSVNQWGSQVWTTMHDAFAECGGMDVVATDVPDLSQVEDMSYMFDECKSLVGNSTFGSWDVSNVKNMNWTFQAAEKFNQNIGGWNVSNVTEMEYTFHNANAFDQNLGDWNVSNLTNILWTFFYAGLSTENYDALLNGWIRFDLTVELEEKWENKDMVLDAHGLNYCKGKDARDLLEESVANGGYNWSIFADDYNCDYYFLNAGELNVVKVPEGQTFVIDVQATPLANGDDEGVDDQGIGNGLTFYLTDNGNGIDNSLFNITLNNGEIEFNAPPYFNAPKDSNGDNVYEIEIAIKDSEDGIAIKDMTIIVLPLTDSPNDFFITEWETDSADQSITIPTQGDGYNYTVDWSYDGTTFNPESTGVMGNITHKYADAGPHTIAIIGLFPRIYFFESGSADKIYNVKQWGAIQWSSMERAFAGCSNLDVTADDAPDLSRVTNMNGMFLGASDFNEDISDWNVSNVRNMSSMFTGASAFNGDISDWNVSNVTNMGGMFLLAMAFNGDISGWNVSNVINMDSMFEEATAFNGDIGGWNVSNVTNMANMFSVATTLPPIRAHYMRIPIYPSSIRIFVIILTLQKKCLVCYFHEMAQRLNCEVK